MTSRGSVFWLIVLLPALAAPDFSQRLINGSTPAEGEPATESRYDDEREEPAQETSDDQPTPLGHLAPQPGPLEQIQRPTRLPGLFKVPARPPERHVVRSQYSQSPGARVGRAVAQAHCFTVSLSVVAPPVQSHAPPQVLAIL